MHLQRSPDIPQLQPLLRWLLPGVVVVGFLLARLFPFQAIPPLCPFRRFAGLPCIGCGGTRSWVHMAHLRISEAFTQSPLGAVLFIAAALMVLYLGARSTGLLPAWRLHTSRTEAMGLRIMLGALLLTHWLYLLLSGVAA